MYCPKCGNLISDDCKTCNFCNTSYDFIDHQQKNTFSNVTQSAVKVNKEKTFCIIASITFIISLFEPYISISLLGTYAEKSLIQEEDSVFFILICILALVFSIIKEYLGVAIVGGFAFGLSVYKTLVISNLKYIPKDETSIFDEVINLSFLVNKEIGFYLMYLGAILLVVSGIYGIYLKKRNTKNINPYRNNNS